MNALKACVHTVQYKTQKVAAVNMFSLSFSSFCTHKLRLNSNWQTNNRKGKKLDGWQIDAKFDEW